MAQIHTPPKNSALQVRVWLATQFCSAISLLPTVLALPKWMYVVLLMFSLSPILFYLSFQPAFVRALHDLLVQSTSNDTVKLKAVS
jgi:hypothetical protein